MYISKKSDKNQTKNANSTTQRAPLRNARRPCLWVCRLQRVLRAHSAQLCDHTAAVNGVDNTHVLHELLQLSVISVAQQHAVEACAHEQSAVRGVIGRDGGDVIPKGLR